MPPAVSGSQHNHAEMSEPLDSPEDPGLNILVPLPGSSALILYVEEDGTDESQATVYDYMHPSPAARSATRLAQLLG